MSPEIKYMTSVVDPHPEHCDGDITAAVAQMKHGSKSLVTSPCLFCHWDVTSREASDQTDVPNEQRKIIRTLPNGCPLFEGVEKKKAVLVKSPKKRGA